MLTMDVLTPKPDATSDKQSERVALLDEIKMMIDRLSPSDLMTVKYFAEFLHEHPEAVEAFTSMNAQQSQYTEDRYPTIGVPAKNLDGWAGKYFAGYEGDSLEDSEALYDDV
ncbi:MAG: hypothetical protein AAF639_42415 [Chloroflexota bacterium]